LDQQRKGKTERQAVWKLAEPGCGDSLEFPSTSSRLVSINGQRIGALAKGGVFRIVRKYGMGERRFTQTAVAWENPPSIEKWARPAWLHPSSNSAIVD
jgi:hypothetical protein